MNIRTGSGVLIIEGGDCQASLRQLLREGFRVWGLGFRVQSLGFRAWGLGFRVGGFLMIACHEVCKGNLNPKPPKQEVVLSLRCFQFMTQSPGALKQILEPNLLELSGEYGNICFRKPPYPP